jgi:hypothetical protein
VLRRRWILIAVFVILLAAGSLYFGTHHRRSTLLPLATQVPLPAGMLLDNYQWRSDHELITREDVRPNLNDDIMAGRTTARTRDYRVVTIDSGTAAKTILSAFTLSSSWRADDGKIYPYDLDYWTDDAGRISSDGRWTIWVEMHRYHIVGSNGRHFIVANPASRLFHHVDYMPYFINSKVAWMAGRDEWAEVRNDSAGVPHIKVHSVDGKVLREAALGLLKAMSAHDVAYPVMLGVTPSNHALIWDENDKLVDIDLMSPTLPQRVLTLRKPAEGELLDVILSPDGKRLALRTHVNPKHFVFPSWLGWVPPLLQDSVQPLGTHIVWTSDLDGSHLREVGRETLSEDPLIRSSAYNSDRTFSSFRWLPDGKRLSFMYDEKLWTVSAQ